MTSADEPRSAGPAEVALDGELDISTLDQAQRRVSAAEQDAPALLVIDLSRLTLVDSSGVRLVLLADDRARAAGRGLAVRLGEGPALRVFQALGLLDKVTVVRDAPDGSASDP